MSRILFLTTYGTQRKAFKKLIDKHHLADHINDVSHPEPFEAEIRLIEQNIERHAKNKRPSTQDDQALSENAEVGVQHHAFLPHTGRSLSKSIPQIMKILSRRTVQLPPLHAPVTFLSTRSST